MYRWKVKGETWSIPAFSRHSNRTLHRVARIFRGSSSSTRFAIMRVCVFVCLVACSFPPSRCFRDPALGDIMSIWSVDCYGAVRCLLLILLFSLSVQILFWEKNMWVFPLERRRRVCWGRRPHVFTVYVSFPLFLWWRTRKSERTWMEARGATVLWHCLLRCSSPRLRERVSDWSYVRVNSIPSVVQEAAAMSSSTITESAGSIVRCFWSLEVRSSTFLTAHLHAFVPEQRLSACKKVDPMTRFVPIICLKLWFWRNLKRKDRDFCLLATAMLCDLWCLSFDADTRASLECNQLQEAYS